MRSRTPESATCDRRAAIARETVQQINASNPLTTSKSPDPVALWWGSLVGEGHYSARGTDFGHRQMSEMLHGIICHQLLPPFLSATSRGNGQQPGPTTTMLQPVRAPCRGRNTSGGPVASLNHEGCVCSRHHALPSRSATTLCHHALPSRDPPSGNELAADRPAISKVMAGRWLLPVSRPLPLLTPHSPLRAQHSCALMIVRGTLWRRTWPPTQLRAS